MASKIGSRPVGFEPEYQEGEHDYAHGKKITDNPYDKRSIESHYWRMGYTAAEEKAEAQKVG